MLYDTFKRNHDYLRISLTDNCNLRCFYCMPEEDISCATREQLMSPDEILNIAKQFVALGVNKIRLTGGEPLVRKEAAEIIAKLSALPVTLTMTTNGLRLHEFVPQILEAGMRSLNISLDTLNADTFTLITRRQGFETVLNNIELLLSHGIHVKVNMVVMRGINEQEINDFVRWTVDKPVHVRFIEFMPFSGNKWQGEKVVTSHEILEHIEKEFSFISLGKEPNGTARKYFVPGSLGTFAIISTMSHPFCEDCNRMRLTADGKMKNCLFSNGETDILAAFRRNEDIVPLIVQSVLNKKEKLGGQFGGDFGELNAEELHNRSMIKIGG
ncbi:MAG: GTP 3',8-cyclase MoaA [Bacteroidia bacterium]|nr:GTP 3',8-cyclase MoaA [Bacteroidia bacterium]